MTEEYVFTIDDAYDAIAKRAAIIATSTLLDAAKIEECLVDEGTCSSSVDPKSALDIYSALISQRGSKLERAVAAALRDVLVKTTLTEAASSKRYRKRVAKLSAARDEKNATTKAAETGLLNSLCERLATDHAALVSLGVREPADGQATTIESVGTAVSQMAGVKASSLDDLRTKAKAFRMYVGEIDSRDLICLDGPWQDLAASIATDAATLL